MKHYYISLAHKHPHLRWVHFPDSRPWFNRETGTIDLTVQLVGADAAARRIEVQDRTGALCHVDLLPAEVPEGRPDFRNQPEAARQIWRGRVRVAGAQQFTLRDAASGEMLAEVAPGILFPEFLFTLLGELRETLPGWAPQHFVETGTLFAHTTLHASHWFDDVTTIELSPELATEAAAHLAHRPNVTVLQGHSGEILPSVIAGLRGPTVFFLDAHWSGDDSVDWHNALFKGYPVNTARLETGALSEADRQVPLKAELEQIATQHAHQGVVLIDDWGGVGRSDYAFKGEDWRNLDRQALQDWFAAHPRTRAHHPLDPHRYLWILDAKG